MKFLQQILLFILCSALTLCLWSCSDNDDPAPAEPVDRTVLVYIVAANSLGMNVTIGNSLYRAVDSLDIEEMTAAIVDNHALGNQRWIVFHSTYTDSRLIEISANGTRVLKTYSNEPAITMARMEQVIADTKALAPARKYGIVLWSHADGWLENGIAEELNPLSFGYHQGKRMNLTSLRMVLEDKGFDFIYFDCCLMGGIEVVYELRHCADYIVACPSELPRDGSDYVLNVKEIADGSEQALVRAATNTFNHYNSQLIPEDRTASVSVIRTAGLDALAQAVIPIYDATPMEHPLSIVTNYYGSATTRQAYYLDFGEYIEALCNASNLDPTLLQAFNNALDNAVIYHAATPKLWNQWPIYNNSGLSTRVFNNPEDFNIKGYNRLQWAADVVSHHIH
ncbi:MAG: clostripain-related cysteine peptidase [Muribaculaceae bacterium]